MASGQTTLGIMSRIKPIFRVLDLHRPLTGRVSTVGRHTPCGLSFMYTSFIRYGVRGEIYV